MMALTAMDKLLFWLGLGAAQKGAGSKPTKNRHPVVSVVVGILIAVLIAVGVFRGLRRVHRSKEASGLRFVFPYWSTPAIKLIFTG